MFIEKIEIENFKSFKEKHCFCINNKLSFVQGNNGSGKTNFLHAIAFVFDIISDKDIFPVVNEKADFASVTVHITDSTKEKIVLSKMHLSNQNFYYKDGKEITKKDISEFCNQRNILPVCLYNFQKNHIKFNEGNCSDDFIEGFSQSYKELCGGNLKFEKQIWRLQSIENTNWKAIINASYEERFLFYIAYMFTLQKFNKLPFILIDDYDGCLNNIYQEKLYKKLLPQMSENCQIFYSKLNRDEYYQDNTVILN